MTGCALAVGCFDRPNYLLLVVPLAFVFWKSKGERRVVLMGQGVSLVAVTVMVYAALTLAVHGEFVLPANGPYNLYAGQNAYSESVLLERLNAEPALYMALQADTTAPKYGAQADEMRPYYTHASEVFMKEHPAEEVKLVGVKLYTLLRADTKVNGVRSRVGLMKLALALTLPLWAAVVVWSRMTGRYWESADTLACVVMVVYAIPFLVTNSDPRFRTPLDILAIAHGVGLLARGREAI